jgi:peroxiredoxin
MSSFSAVSTQGRRAILLCGALLLPPLTPAWAGEAETLLVDAARTDVVGTRAPVFKLQTLEGDTIDLASFYGEKAVYLKFWATWCIPCRQQMPHFESVFQHAGDDLAVIGINAGFNETLADIQDFREEYGIHMPIVVDDGTLAGAFNLRITPQHVVIGKDGVIQYMGQEAGAELEAALERARNAPVQAVSGYGAVAEGPQFGVGDKLPAETLTTSDGGSFALADAGARSGSVLVFMLPWCESYLADTRPAAAASCRQVREQVEMLQQQDDGLRWLGINSGLWTMPGDLQNYSRQYGTTLPLALDADSHLFRAFHITSAPTVIVTDAEGRIVKRIEGYDPALGKVLSAL